MKLERILASENIADELSQKELENIGMECFENYKNDEGSRQPWKERMQESLKLALQVVENKSYPWPNAANIKFPLITISAIQFAARAYPALISGTDIVKFRSVGPDEDGEKEARARRVSAHMSYQLLEEDEDWEEETDKLLMALPILGCAFKKTYFDSELQHNVSYYVSPENLIVNYYAPSLEKAECITEVLGDISEREIIERQRLGFYRNVELSLPTNEDAFKDGFAKKREGLQSPSGDGKFFRILEQHCYLDLDDDGYAEPYIVTFDEATQEVLRIVPRFDKGSIVYTRDEKRIAKIFPEHYYIKYKFIPSPDGGIYELGFGALLGPINESINSIINRLLDAGTLAVLPSGFLGTGMRLKKGEWRFKPGEWKQVNATGDDIRKSIVPLPVKEPSSTLFNLLSLLIEYGERVSGVTDMMVGKTPGQNTPATTAMASLEQGQKVFTGIHKRIYKCLTKEFRRLYELNSKYLNPTEYFQVVEGEDMEVFQEDYQGDPTDVRPNADPNVASDQQRVMKAEALMAVSQSAPLYDIYAVHRRYLDALQIPAISEVLPEPGSENAPQPPEPPIKDQATMMKVQGDLEIKNIELEAKLELMAAQIENLKAQAFRAVASAENEERELTRKEYESVVNDVSYERELDIKEKEAVKKEKESKSSAKND